MKCIRCNHDSKHKDRPNRTCPQCKGKFAFEPQEKDPFTDVAFQRAIERVSGGGKVRWTPDHLYYELGRRLRPRFLRTHGQQIIVGAVALLGLIGVSLIFGPTIAVAYTILLVLLGLIQFRRFRYRFHRLDRSQFGQLFAVWQRAHGRPEGLILPSEQASRTPSRALEPDLADYSFDRAVICDRARTVDLLLANNFHFENNCAVLSIDGYPPAPFETIRTMLRRNPRLQVFALHDATVDGCMMAHRLTTDPSWFAGQVPVIDVGLRPGQAEPLRGLWQMSSGSTIVPGVAIKPDEAAWLSQFTVELAAIRPDQVLKRLFRAMNRRTSEDDDDGDGDFIVQDLADEDRDESRSIVIEDDDSFSVHADADDGGADSFG